MANTVTELLRRRFGGKSLPYDAEIEYLQSSGTQYIDTGIKTEMTDTYSVDIDIIDTGFAVGDGNNFFFLQRGSHGGIYVTAWTSNTKVADKVRVNVFIENGTITATPFGGQSVVFSMTRTGKPTTTTWLFQKRGNATGCSCKIYSYSIKRNNVYLIDLIPVRVGTTGYMYDKVSGQLFGNAGTGDFILGNDK